MTSSSSDASWLAWLARHPVAANLIMLLMMVSGLWSLQQLNTQFFPTFELDFVTVQVEWRGATAEEVADAVTSPLEEELRDVDGLRELTSTSAEGSATIVLEFREGTDMTQATESVKDRVSGVRNLPEDSREPTISRVLRYDPVARLLVSGDLNTREVRELSRMLEEELLERGVTRVQLTGLAEQEISIDVDQHRLNDLGMSFADLARQVDAQSRDVPAGDAGERDVARQLRGIDQARSLRAFEALPIPLEGGRSVALGDLATITRQARDNEIELRVAEGDAVEILVERAEDEDALAAARVLEAYLQERQPTLPETVHLQVFDEFWQFISERITLLLKNGLGGLLLVIGVLLAFLSSRMAFWVTLGIPTSFLAALTVLFLTGGSINMMSLFAFIMALGIIVDNAVVVGENAYSRFQNGEGPAEAAINGARRMFVPVMAASLTTIAAFLPLMIIGGPIGNILFDIPLVVVCVIIAAIIQAFFILPGHLRRSFERAERRAPNRYRQAMDNGFNRFRDGPFRRAVELSIRNPWATMAMPVALLVVAIGLAAGGRLDFTFFPSVEGETVHANVTFAPGTPRARVEAYLDRLEESLLATNEELGGDIVRTRVSRTGSTIASDPADTRFGENYGGMFVELTPPDARGVRNRAFIRAWEDNAPQAPGLENLVIRERGQGPPGADIDVRITGAPPEQLKAASLEVQADLRQRPGVSGITDDLPYGPEQWVHRLNDQGRALGLSAVDLSNQLRDAYGGVLAQIFQHRRDEVEVWVRLAAAERDALASLEDFRIRTPDGNTVPLGNVADLETRRSFASLRHFDGRLAVRPTADVDAQVANANRIRADLEENLLPELRERYGVQTAFEGQAADQEETLADMRAGLVLALALIYLVLAFVFSSYGWPLLVMAVIPFGVVGAFFGHWIFGLDLTILSLFGLFGLSGIVVNNSIILVTFYREIRDQSPGAPVEHALTEASRLRLRPVLVTTLTTIGGLLPLLFETSVQAQFLIPMAIAIAFGLAVASLIVLFLVPAMLAVYENAAGMLQGASERASASE
ncbi:efflux RND transporter permease subunit [Aquisalimonas sp. 2447]|uniref:efflux RND transporter permease subunit n=1 Tax=Aquisalimonas sp. 2447 TaxID=2740807 RepID=UPI0014323E20|nr:efflux RND transporter permease subunit [Aquisalimonas sp. 2447]QIT55632.1 efflux RND transporter permease subunit [Aquisalimonas sp. 2447]